MKLTSAIFLIATCINALPMPQSPDLASLIDEVFGSNEQTKRLVEHPDAQAALQKTTVQDVASEALKDENVVNHVKQGNNEEAITAAMSNPTLVQKAIEALKEPEVQSFLENTGLADGISKLFTS
jgi:hypothetical protein